MSVRDGAAPTTPLGADLWGFTWPEAIEATISARRADGQWLPLVTALSGRYSVQTRLLPGRQEVTGPQGNTTAENHCDQIEGLDSLGKRGDWYMLRAVAAHEHVHAAAVEATFQSAAQRITTALEAVALPDDGTLDPDGAVGALQASPAFTAANAHQLKLWQFDTIDAAALDDTPNGPTERAEHGEVDPMIAAIRDAAAQRGWNTCDSPFGACP